MERARACYAGYFRRQESIYIFSVTAITFSSAECKYISKLNDNHWSEKLRLEETDRTLKWHKYRYFWDSLREEWIRLEPLVRMFKDLW